MCPSACTKMFLNHIQTCSGGHLRTADLGGIILVLLRIPQGTWTTPELATNYGTPLPIPILNSRNTPRSLLKHGQARKNLTQSPMASLNLNLGLHLWRKMRPSVEDFNVSSSRLQVFLFALHSSIPKADA